MKKKALLTTLLLLILLSCSENTDDSGDVSNPMNEEKAFVYNGNTKTIVELDIVNGNEIEVSETFNVFDNSFFPAYLESENLIVGIDSNFNSSTFTDEPRLVKVNLENGDVSFVSLEQSNNYGEIVVANNRVFAYSSSKNKLIEIDIIDGSENNFSEEFQPFDDYFIPSYNSITNEIIGIDTNFNSSTNQNEPQLIKIDLLNGNVSFLDLNDDSYGVVTVDNTNGNTYVYNGSINKLVQINLENGSETVISDTFNPFDNYFVPDFSISTKEVIGIDDENNVLLKINVENESISTINLSNNEYGEILVK